MIACGHATPAVARDTTEAAPPVARGGQVAWEWLSRVLPGTWRLEGKQFRVSYKLISAKSALVETWGVGGDHETMTVFHPDHDALLLVHYCAQGNQPRLRAVDGTSTSASFRFLDATNVLPGQAILVERRFEIDAAGAELSVTEVYRQPHGGDETTTYRFRKETAPL
jgi:hypothetical protein